jgi:hypothetical protein
MPFPSQGTARFVKDKERGQAEVNVFTNLVGMKMILGQSLMKWLHNVSGKLRLKPLLPALTRPV